MDLKKVAPGIMVGARFTVSIPHPDPCWVISNPDKTAAMTNGESSLLVFSDEEKLHNFMKEAPKDSYIASKYSWDDLVDTFNEQCSQVLVDHEGVPGFYQTVPLQKGI